MKKTLGLLMLISLTLATAVQARTAQVGVALANFDLNFVSILRTQMMHELDTQGMKGQFSDAKGDVALQVQQIDDFINQGVDAIILNPVDTQGVLPMIQAAKNAGIPLIFVNRKPEVPLTGAMSYVGSDSALSGKMQIEELAKLMNYRGNIAILMGALSNEEARERTRAVEEFVAQHKNMKVIEKQTAKWQRNEAVDVVSSWLLNGRSINAIVANNDEMAIGAIMALNQAKKKDVMVAGIDGTPDGLQFIKNGEMVVTVFQDAKAQATGAVRVANALINKQKTDNYHWIPYQTVTRANYEQFIQQNQK
ncbi:substrate-binding domain-containing protein [Pantoea sp. B550]|uniref:substrate-binding domain-containing protein n=1 Tax=Pantoea TaxID=53335 RepID=UPI000F098000|nr:MULTISPECIES: substrate-binding domain-containing protein [Pantoea]MCL9652554.1 substrate-binding domain-containing protein [Pantoea agglomerans]MCP1204224.1 substrate-binding domain-containing protein [Pantoea sp. B550]MCT2417946.1 substrate-binding domain-containing protein [Pantoea sp. XY16]NBB56428.1 substrate-binding domain-containing protein [Pantoea vagans]RNA76539.1 sugar ABC transporter substrate-binding protein [[Curtobacterium] plantarum]